MFSEHLYLNTINREGAEIESINIKANEFVTLQSTFITYFIQ